MECKFCGEENPECLERHHIVPRRYNGSDSEKNLVTVCSNCHQKLENLYDKRFYEAILEKLKSEIEEHPKYRCNDYEIVSEGEEMKACPKCGSKNTIPVGSHVEGKSRLQSFDYHG